ncbi:MAG TPA: universal stress protein [Jatrophihabitans sp.]|jgi:nucleotide-binding universal stress UspA family protein
MTTARDVPDRRQILVGVEAVGDSVAAIDWAAREAAARHAPLTLVHTWDWGSVPLMSAQYGYGEKQAIEQEGGRILARAKEHALAAGAFDVHVVRRRGYAPDVLLDMTADAALLVVGSRHASTIARGVFGSVSTAVVSEAMCPVVVLSGPPGAREARPQVVAGVSCEPHDQDVLAFAFDYANRNQLPLRTVFCWQSTFGSLSLPPPDVAKLRLSETLAGWRAQYSDVETHLVVRRGHPIDILVASSASQALVVVGRHAPHLRFGALLGSTSLGVVHHATCPVAVIPPTVVAREPGLVREAVGEPAGASS